MVERREPESRLVGTETCSVPLNELEYRPNRKACPELGEGSLFRLYPLKTYPFQGLITMSAASPNWEHFQFSHDLKLETESLIS